MHGYITINNSTSMFSLHTHTHAHTLTHTHTHTHTHTLSAGEDFEAVTTTLVFGSDFQSGGVQIPILDDNQVESSETIPLQLQIASEELGSGSIQLIPEEAYVLIQDNDSEWVYSNSCSSATVFIHARWLHFCLMF